MTNTFNQNHHGSGDNIVNVGRQRFVLTPDILEAIASKLDKSRSVGIVWRAKGKGTQMASRLEDYLKERGFTIGSKMGIGTMAVAGTEIEFDEPITVVGNGYDVGGSQLMPGQQFVAIEPGAI